MVCLALVVMKILSKRTLLIVIFTGLALSLVFFYFIFKNSIESELILPVENPIIYSNEINPGLPLRLKIPGINVDVAIEQVGLTSNGEMGVPNGPDDVAWFELGPRPGENGSAVIAGHYGRWKNGEGSVFDDLNKLRKGDILYIEDDMGVTISFVVRESRSYYPDEDASDVFNLNDGKPHLNLITCEGVWDEILKSYSERLVVFTDKE
jgi:LPXTG-site transpeptidase (sortase) family protein